MTQEEDEGFDLTPKFGFRVSVNPESNKVIRTFEDGRTESCGTFESVAEAKIFGQALYLATMEGLNRPTKKMLREVRSWAA